MKLNRINGFEGAHRPFELTCKQMSRLHFLGHCLKHVSFCKCIFQRTQVKESKFEFLVIVQNFLEVQDSYYYHLLFWCHLGDAFLDKVSSLQVIHLITMHTGNHTLAVVKGDGLCDTISKVFAASFDKINQLQQTGFHTVDGINYQIELFYVFRYEGVCTLVIILTNYVLSTYIFCLSSLV